MNTIDIIRLTRTRSLLSVIALSGALLTAAGNAHASKVQFFYQPPTVQQLLDLFTVKPKYTGRVRAIEIVADKAPAPLGATVTPQPTPASLQVAATNAPASADAQPSTVEAQADTTADTEPAVMQTASASTADSSKVELASSNDVPTPFAFLINFAFDSAVIPDDSYAFIDAVAEMLVADPSISLTVEGHTDAAGSDAYNLELSHRRAVAVRDYLVHSGGIDANRISVAAKGEGEPLTTDPYEAKNRRVEFHRADVAKGEA